MDRVYKEERNYILSVVKKVKASGCNVLLIQKSILRDAVTDLALHYLAKAKIMVSGSARPPLTSVHCSWLRPLVLFNMHGTPS